MTVNMGGILTGGYVASEALGCISSETYYLYEQCVVVTDTTVGLCCFYGGAFYGMHQIMSSEDDTK